MFSGGFGNASVGPNLKEAPLGFAVSPFPQESCTSLGLGRSWSSSAWGDAVRERDTECPAPFLVSLLSAPEVGWVVFYPRDALEEGEGVRGRSGETLAWWQPCSEEELEVASNQGKRWPLLLSGVWPLGESSRPSFSLS